MNHPDYIEFLHKRNKKLQENWLKYDCNDILNKKGLRYPKSMIKEYCQLLHEVKTGYNDNRDISDKGLIELLKKRRKSSKKRRKSSKKRRKSSKKRRKSSKKRRKSSKKRRKSSKKRRKSTKKRRKSTKKRRKSSKKRKKSSKKKRKST